MNVKDPHKRLQTLWGVIDRQHNALIESGIKGKRVLDIGCGYGALVSFLTDKGYDAEGIDDDPEVIRTARQLFPAAHVRRVNAENLTTEPASTCDTIILKDSFHHVLGEGDVTAAFENFKRMLRPEGRMIIYDPNPMWILRLARKAVAHRDPEAPLEAAVRVLATHGFEVKRIDYYETIGLPLSGGYVGPRLIPNIAPLNRIVATANRWLSRFAAGTGLGPVLCWRYLICADKT
jgi:SAM-dependent methyltransferase